MFKIVSVRVIVLFILGAALSACGSSGPSTASSATGVVASAPPVARSASIGHVFMLVMENKDFKETFASTSAAPFLSKTLVAQGAMVEGYYGTGHASLDNYISMISGQGPNSITQADCVFYLDFMPMVATPNAALGNQAAGSGCIFPTGVPNLADQLKAKSISWKGYMEDMGNDPAHGVTSSCGHPAVNSQDKTQSASATDGYATRHNPFMYFHTIIDDSAYCNSHVVNLMELESDLASLDTTPQYVFITPNLCSDGHDGPCTNTDATGDNKGGLVGINNFLSVWAPKILASPAFQKDGLMIVTFDESDYTNSMDATSCCGESSVNTPTAGLSGAGGGKVGAVLISPFIKPGTVVDPAKFQYNHYSTLRSVEDIFGLSYLGYAGANGMSSFGPEVFTAQVPVYPTK